MKTTYLLYVSLLTKGIRLDAFPGGGRGASVPLP